MPLNLTTLVASSILAVLVSPMRKLVGGLLENPEFKGLVIFDADFDANKDALVKLNAHTVTTLVIYRDNAEILRSSGETRPGAVETLLRNAM